MYDLLRMSTFSEHNFLCSFVQYVFPSIQKINTVETNVPNDFTRKLPKIAFGSFICFQHMIV